MLIRLLENNELISVYQPIVDTYRASIIGYESLVRGPEGCALHTPSALFHEAAMHGLVDSLEMYCTQNAVAQFKPEQFHGQLFINTNPNLLCTHDFVEQLLSLQRSTTAQIVIELSEQHAVTQLNELKRVVHRLRIAGLQFAIDDLGAGHSSLKLWAEIRPEYVKIDRYFVQDIHLNPYKREFVQHIVTLAKNMHATVIAEGIEKIEELRQVQKIGIFAAQGFFIGRPSTEVLVDDRLQSLLHHDHQVERYDSLHSLIEETTTVHPHRRVADVFDYFQQNKPLRRTYRW